MTTDTTIADTLREAVVVAVLDAKQVWNCSHFQSWAARCVDSANRKAPFPTDIDYPEMKPLDDSNRWWAAWAARNAIEAVEYFAMYTVIDQATNKTWLRPKAPNDPKGEPVKMIQMYARFASESAATYRRLGDKRS